jgi:hypothetical protein
MSYDFQLGVEAIGKTAHINLLIPSVDGIAPEKGMCIVILF